MTTKTEIRTMTRCVTIDELLTELTKAVKGQWNYVSICRVPYTNDADGLGEFELEVKCES